MNVTTILDRYLFAVQSYLSKDQAADIVAEIGEHLQTQMEERETALGRPLTNDEHATIIRAYGHPRVVAARYGRVQYLIGPDLLPFYWSALSLVATLVVAIELLGGGISAIVSHNGVLFFGTLAAAWNSLIWIFGIVTIVFAISERVPQQQGRLVDTLLRWDPRRLPEPGLHAPARRTSALVEFIANVIALLVLLDAGGSHHIPLDVILANALIAVHATLTPAWHAVHIGAIAGSALLAISAMALFLRPQLTLLHEFVRAISSLIVIIGVVLTLRGGPWILPSNGDLNTYALYALIAAIVVLGLQAAVSTRTLLRATVKRNKLGNAEGRSI